VSVGDLRAAVTVTSVPTANLEATFTAAPAGLPADVLSATKS